MPNIKSLSRNLTYTINTMSPQRNANTSGGDFARPVDYNGDEDSTKKDKPKEQVWVCGCGARNALGLLLCKECGERGSVRP